jgi:hypothetical protein
MALPTITTPTYILKQPSTGEEIEYRPFLVGEEKILLMAIETNDQAQIYPAILKLVNSCTNGKIGNKKDAMFDIEFAFLRIRGKSIAESIELTLICPDDGETKVKYTLNTEDVEVLVDDAHNREIELNEDFNLVMRYPNVKDTLDADKITSDTEKTFFMIKNCIDIVHYKEETYNRVDLSNKELDDFFNSMTQAMFERVQEFFITMPRLKHKIEVENPNTKVKSTMVLEGLGDFLV